MVGTNYSMLFLNNFPTLTSNWNKGKLPTFTPYKSKMGKSIIPNILDFLVEFLSQQFSRFFQQFF
jgi:hypothetical protein